MEYVHSRSGRFVVGVLALLVACFVLWVFTSLLAGKIFESKYHPVSQDDQFLTKEEKLEILRELNTQAVPMTEEEKLQALRQIHQTDSGKSLQNTTQTDTSPPNGTMTNAEKLKALQSLRTQTN
ncbi:hypothetical protein EPO17_00900 [Patescibacteria group bacterium]|nr:MAG: hypothetical protein EPO17_00900 [Patescibacteria group bacterium]